MRHTYQSIAHMKSRNFVVATYATERYDYALPNFGRRFRSAIYQANQKSGTFIFIGDKSEKIKESALENIGKLLPKDWEFIFIPLDLADKDLKNYKDEAQLLIAQMQSRAFDEARMLGADYFWSLESDVLVAPNSLSVSKDILGFDNGYYDIVMCTYPSQGGGSFLGGFGSYRHAINEDFLPEEKELPEELEKEIEERKKQEEDPAFEPKKEWFERGLDLHDEVKKCPPKGNVFSLNAKNWRRRGWMEYAYPAMGKGCIMPTDWVGLGCTMMTKKALTLAHFDGYEGKGTQDLYVGWNFWKPNDLNMCVTTHSICDHIIRKRGEGDTQLWDDFVHVQAYHEPEGEFKGHLRQRHLPFYTHLAGEKPKIEETEEEQKDKK